MGDPDATLSKPIEVDDRASGVWTVPILYLALESRRPHATVTRFGLGDIDEVLVGRGAERRVERSTVDGKRQLRVAVNDPFMSSSHARLAPLMGRWTALDQGSKNGSMVNGATVRRQVLADGDLVELGQTFFLFRASVVIRRDEPVILDEDGSGGFAGMSTLVPALARQLSTLAQVAPSRVSVVIEGPTGSGKEVIARALHAMSGRAGPFIAVNCGALPAALVESELFGHKKGAFSGAGEERPGLVRAADKGTLFLDEIAELPAASQVAFLRVLQEREVVPIGGTRPVPVDLRVVAASHRDLDSMVETGSLRSDLFGRLSGFRLRLPALSDRREDLGLVCASILRRLAGERADRLSLEPRAARALFSHDWPRNIRELEKCLETALVVAGAGPITVAHLPPVVQAALDDGAQAADASSDSIDSGDADDVDRRLRLEQLLREHAGNVTAVARVMGKAPVQIRRWLRRFGLDPHQFRR